MYAHTPYEAYRHISHNTADSNTQILLLYDAAINYVRQAREAIEKQDNDSRYQLIDKTISIMHGLRSCLDFSISKEVAGAMDRYYDALDKLLISVQHHQDERTCDAIIENLKTIRNVWQEINTVPSQDDMDYEDGVSVRM